MDVEIVGAGKKTYKSEDMSVENIKLRQYIHGI
jgi:hypothetical protein